MSKGMNFIFIFYTLSMSVLMCISSEDDGKFKRECEVSFNEFDMDQNDLITETDIDNFLTSSAGSVIPQKDKALLKQAIMKVIDANGGQLNLDNYVKYMKQKEKENPNVNHETVRQMFPGKEIVTLDQLCQKIPKLDRSKGDLRPSYTIDEIVHLVFYNEIVTEIPIQ